VITVFVVHLFIKLEVRRTFCLEDMTHFRLETDRISFSFSVPKKTIFFYFSVFYFSAEKEFHTFGIFYFSVKKI